MLKVSVTGGRPKILSTVSTENAMALLLKHHDMHKDGTNLEEFTPQPAALPCWPAL